MIPFSDILYLGVFLVILLGVSQVILVLFSSSNDPDVDDFDDPFDNPEDWSDDEWNAFDESLK